MRSRKALLALSVSWWPLAALAIDLAPLWDFADPAASEQRMRAALATARGDDGLILKTQIARSHGLRGDFDTARRLLHEIETEAGHAGAEVRVRWQLELGRTWASATHAATLLTPQALVQARGRFERAHALAREAGLDGLAIDALHMFAFIDKAPADQLRWGEAALALALASTQPEARRWEASIRHNIGVALHQLGRLDDALGQFRQALAVRESGGSARSVHVARWMVAWTLRGLGRVDEALQIQRALEQAAAAAGKPDPHVFKELEALYRLAGDEARAGHYRQLEAQVRGGP
jgi:tetratricopeptide (TPR) repeat protein